MGIRTIGQFLIGRREAILQIAANRSAIWIGLIFVLSAGFAREYDGEDLLHEPWHLLIPLAASLAASFLLFVLIRLLIVRYDVQRGSFLSEYRAFLTLFWMTAPLAWLYAIPTERYLLPADAAAVNLWLLGVVAFWRVALMIRVVSVLTGLRPLTATFPVMLYADVVAIGLIQFLPVPVIVLMGGIHLSDTERVLQNAKFLVTFWGILSLPVWAIGTIIVFSKVRLREPAWLQLSQPGHGTISLATWSLALLSVIVWSVVLPFTQPQQRARRIVQDAFEQQGLAAAVQEISGRRSADFPPHWDPPPPVTPFGYDGQLIDSLESLVAGDAPLWVRELYYRKFERPVTLAHLSDDDLSRYAQALSDLPEGARIAKKHASEVQDALGDADVSDPVSSERRTLYAAIAQLGDNLPAINPDEETH